MRYAQIRSMDVSDGEGIGTALFVQGCPIHCYNCFNPETWDFNGGKEWTPEAEDKFIELAGKPYVTRISILGGEPLAEQNLDDVLGLLNKIRVLLPKKAVWIYTGYEWESIFNGEVYDSKNQKGLLRSNIVQMCDVLVDGPFIDDLKDLTLKWRGSSNQRVIDVQKSMLGGKVILWDRM